MSYIFNRDVLYHSFPLRDNPIPHGRKEILSAQMNPSFSADGLQRHGTISQAAQHIGTRPGAEVASGLVMILG